MRKTLNKPFKAADVHDWLTTHNKEDIWGGLNQMRAYMAGQHKAMINKMLNSDFEIPKKYDKNGCWKY